MDKEQRQELVRILDELYRKYFGDDDVVSARRNMDMYRDLDDYGDWLAHDFSRHGFTEDAALDLALDDAADVWGDRLELEAPTAMLVIADEWERAANAMEVGSRQAARLLLAARLLRDVLPRVNQLGLDEEIRARAIRDDMLNVVAEAGQRKEDGEPAFRRFLKERGDHAAHTIAMAMSDRPRPASALIVEEDEE